MTAIRNFGLLGIVLQDTAGAAETALTGGYAMPIVSGGVRPVKEYGDLPRAGSSMARLGRFTQRANVGGTVTVLAHPEALGLLLYGAMGSELALGTPAGGVTPHTFVMADNFPQQFTIWSSIGSGSDADVWQFKDAQITRLQIGMTSGENATVEMDIIGKDYRKLGAGLAGWPGGVAPTGAILEDATPRFKMIGSQVKLDSDGAVPVAGTNVESFTFEVNRDVATRYGTALTPQIFAPDRMVNFSAEVTYDSAQFGGWEFIEDAYISGYNATPDQSVPTGAFDVTAGVHPTGATQSLRIVSGGGATLPTTVSIQQNWNYGVDRPEASGDPDIVGFTLDGVCTAPTVGTTEATVILNSARAGKYDL